MFLLRIICCCLLPVLPVSKPVPVLVKPQPEKESSALWTRPSAPPVVKIVFTPDRRPEDPASDSIFYQPTRKLRWADFKATPPLRGPSAAVCYTSFAYEGSSLRKHDTLTLNLTLQVFFVKSASWAKEYIKDASALSHEQLHFDITWLVALRFQQRIKMMPLNIEDYDSVIQYEYLESFREMNRLQKAYDDETSHGTSPSAQLRWQRTIAEAITAITVEGALTGSDKTITGSDKIIAGSERIITGSDKIKQ